MNKISAAKQLPQALWRLGQELTNPLLVIGGDDWLDKYASLLRPGELREAEWPLKVRVPRSSVVRQNGYHDERILNALLHRRLGLVLHLDVEPHVVEVRPQHRC